LDLINPFDGRTYLIGHNLNAVIVNAVVPVKYLFLYLTQVDLSFFILAKHIAVAVFKCKGLLCCLSLTECTVNAVLINAVSTCPSLRGHIVKKRPALRPTNARLVDALYTCYNLPWCFIKTLLFGTMCWATLVSVSYAPQLGML
jgi:hypothetical protein